jgi:hypothetical protein
MIANGNVAEALILVFNTTAVITIPFLTVVAYRGWAMRWRRDLSLWRNFLGVGSLVMTFIVWLGTAYLALSLLTHLPTNFFTGAWTVANAFVALIACACSLALKGRSRVWASVAALLQFGLWTISYLGGP